MIISFNLLKAYVDIDIPVDELASLIGSRLVEIEDVKSIGDKYKGIVIAKAVDVKKVENSDHLSLVKIDDGGVTQNIERDEKGLIQVICGAPNIRSGLTVAWLAPGSIVPDTFDTDKPFEIGSRMLCGFKSNGMIASAKELDLYDDHDGILELEENYEAGRSFTEAFELDDYLLDIENKSLTHRPDCFGIVGFAREVAAILGKKSNNSYPYSDLNPEIAVETDPHFIFEIKDDPNFNLTISIDNPEICSRYEALVMSGIDTTKKSPVYIRTMLSRMGIRPISAIVDMTNYIMLVSGQPLHAFDYDKVVKIAGKADIHVRTAKDNEKLKLIDGREISLVKEDIVIVAGETPIALAGAMGGYDTEVDENTKNIIIESASFNLYSLRATQMRHGIFTEAVTRFTKGQSPDQTAPALAVAITLAHSWTGAQGASQIKDSYPIKNVCSKVEITADYINNVLGSSFSTDKIVTTLKNVEFDVETSGNLLKITSPFWRSDIHIPEDIVEEIGRINGFDSITPILPVRDFHAIKPSDFDEFRTRIRKILVRAGSNELLTYSFIHGDLMKKACQDPDNSYRIINSISPDLQYYRQSLMPSILSCVHSNIKQGYDSFSLFEMNKIHQKSDGLNDEDVPIERESLALVISSKNSAKDKGAPYYQAKYILDYLSMSLGLDLVYRSIDTKSNNPILAPFEYRRSAQILDRATGLSLGFIGEYNKSVSKGFKLSEYTAGFEIDILALFNITNNIGYNYKLLSRFPASERDICFQVKDTTEYSQIISVIDDVLKDVELESTISPIDIYQPGGSENKNITIRIRLVAHDRTLVGDDIASIINILVSSVTKSVSATVI